MLDAARKLGFETRAYHHRRAWLLKQAGEVDQGREEQERADARPPDSAIDFFLLGEEECQRDRLKDAVNSLNRALALQPTHYWAQFLLAWCHLRLEHWETAKAGLNACLAQREFVWAYLLRSFAHENLHELANAEADFQKAFQLNPNDDARYALYSMSGILHFKQKDLDKAEADFRAAIALKPDQSIAYRSLALVCLAQGRFDQAEEQMQTAIRLGLPEQQVLEYHVDRGRGLLRAKKYAEALAACETALKISRRYPQSHEVCARVLLALEHFEQAERSFDEYLVRGGEAAPDVWRGRGQARMRLGRYLDAADDYTRALERAPDAEIFQHRGWAYFFSDANSFASRDFSRAIELSPDGCNAYIGRGLTHVKQGNYRDGVADAEAALRRKPSSPDMMHNLACVFALAAAAVAKDSEQVNRLRLAADYRGRALSAVQQTLEMLPAEQRPSFWRDQILPDAALTSLHEEPIFKQLKDRY
jgi:tetratricopeptide (TPR) repeat protein